MASIDHVTSVNVVTCVNIVVSASVALYLGFNSGAVNHSSGVSNEPTHGTACKKNNNINYNFIMEVLTLKFHPQRS